MESAKIEEKEDFLLVSNLKKKKIKLRTELVNIASKGLNYTFGRQCAKIFKMPDLNEHTCAFVHADAPAKTEKILRIHRKDPHFLINHTYMQIKPIYLGAITSSASDMRNSSPWLNSVTVQ